MTFNTQFYLGIITTLLASHAAANTTDPDAIFQSIQLSITQQSQHFEFNDTNNSDAHLNVWGSRIQYQLGKGPWNIIMDYHQAQASDEDTVNQRDYELEFETKSAGIFIEYYLEHTWFALGLSNSQDTTHYQFNTGTNNTISDDSELTYQGVTLESGYVHYLGLGQLSATLGLTQQQVEESIQYQQDGSSATNYKIDEDGILTSLTVSYGHIYAVSDTLQLAFNTGIRRDITLSGDGRIQQSTRNQGSPNNQNPSSEELQSTSQSASTSQQAQISLQHLKGSISLSVDKLSDQSLSHSYFSAGLGIYF